MSAPDRDMGKANEVDEGAFVPRVPEGGNATPVGEMAVALDLGEDGRWLEIFSQRDANRACLLTQTAIHLYFHHEMKAEGGHPRRWFVLACEGVDGPVGDVCLAVTPPGAQLKDPGLVGAAHVTGFQNRNPYPGFTDRIERLSDAIGLEIEPNWMGTPAAAVRKLGGP